MRVLLAGASGVLGRPLVSSLRADGHEVVGLHRSASGEGRVRAAGGTPIAVDVLDRAALLEAVRGQHFDAVVSQLSALKKAPAMHRDMAVTNRLRTVGTTNLLAVAERTGATRFLTQSMVFGYGYADFGGRVLTEDDRFGSPGQGRFDRHLTAMRSNERQVLESTQLQGIALRYGLFYGPGPAGDSMVESLRRRRLPIVQGGGVLPWVYVDDAVTATVAALEHGRAGTAYNVADEQPVSLSDLATAIAAAVHAPRPRAVPLWMLAPAPYAKALMTGGLRVSSGKAERELGWTPRVPTYREGVLEMAEHYGREAA